MVTLKLHQVNFAHVAIHTVVSEITMSYTRAAAVSKSNQCRNLQGEQYSFKGQWAPHHTVTDCVLFSCYLLIIEGQLPVTPCGFGSCGAAQFILQLCLLWGSDFLLFNSTKSFLIKKPSRGTSFRRVTWTVAASVAHICTGLYKGWLQTCINTDVAVIQISTQNILNYLNAFVSA